MLNKHRSSRSLEEKFSKVFRDNRFHGAQSMSGRGSDLDQTRIIELEIPKILDYLQIASLLDIPCGDQNWVRRIALNHIDYLGADIVPSLVQRNNELYMSETKRFIEFDLTKSVPPRMDLILCRDLFVHLSTDEINSCLANIRASGSTYLLTTTFTDPRSYKNLPVTNLRLSKKLPFLIKGAAWRPINLQLDPFSLPSPLRLINEACTEGNNRFSDKSLGLWKIEDLLVGAM